MSKKMRRRKTLPRKPEIYKVVYRSDDADIPLELVEVTLTSIRQWVLLAENTDDPVTRMAAQEKLRKTARYAVMGERAEQHNDVVAKLDRPGAKNPVREAVIQAMRRYLNSHVGTLDDFLEAAENNPDSGAVSIERLSDDDDIYLATIERHKDDSFVGRTIEYKITTLRNLWTEARNSPLTRYQ